MRRIVLILLALTVVLAPSAASAAKVLDDSFAPPVSTAGIVTGGAIDDVRGKGWRSARPVDRKVGAGYIVYDLSKLPALAGGGTLSFHLVRNARPAHPEERLFSLVDDSFNSVLSFGLHWNGFHQDRYAEIYAPTDGPLGTNANPVFFNKSIEVGQEFWLVCSWDRTGVRFYLDGVELSRGGVAGVFSDPGMPPKKISDGMREFDDFSNVYIPKSRYLVLGNELHDGVSLEKSTFISTLNRFALYDSAMTPRQLTSRSVITSVSDDTFKVAGISGKIVAGDTVNVEMLASPDGAASFDMGNVKGIAMAQVPAAPGGGGIPAVDNGTYRGSYTVKPGDDFEDGYVVGHFVSSDNVAAESLAAASKWTIDTKPVVTFSIDKKDLPADSAAKARVKLVAKDANGNQVAGRHFKLTLATTDEYTGLVGAGDFGLNVGASVETRWKGETDSWGEVEFDYKAGFAAKTVILTAKDLDSGGVTVDYITAFKEASIDIALTQPVSRAAARRGLQYIVKIEASRTELTADGRSRSVIRATVLDPNGSPVANDPVSFTLSSENGTLRTIRRMTDASGVATAEYIAGRKIGIVVVTATAELRGASASVSITLLADAPAKIYLKARPETLPADGFSRADLSVKVTDINDNPNADTKVEFRVAKGGGKLDNADRVTDRFGDAQNRYTSGTTPGVASIMATVRSKVPTAAELAKAKNVLFVPYNRYAEDIRVEKWLKKKGDAFRKGEALAGYTVGRDSAVHVLSAPYDGTMGEQFVEYWDTAEVGQTLATVIPAGK